MGPACPNTPSAFTESTSANPAPAPANMSAPGTANDQLHVTMNNIPHLEPSGTNWVIFCVQFKQAMVALCCWPYFTGTCTCLTPGDKDKPTESEVMSMEAWDHQDNITCYLLCQCLPNMTTLKLSHCSNAKTCWDKLCAEYKAKSTYAQNNLKDSFLEMCCVKGGMSTPS